MTQRMTSIIGQHEEEKISQSVDSDEQVQKMIKEKGYKQNQNSLKRINQRDFIVNTGFNFDITDYFKFQNRSQLQKQKTIFRDLNQYSYIAWVILLYSVVSSAMIPPWLMTIQADKLLRISWKCFMHLIMIIPFVLYEKRTADEQTIEKYTLSYIFRFKNIKKVWILAFATSFWPTTILTAIQWTYISHCMVLGSLTNLFLSFQRTFKNNSTKMEIGGQIIAILGISFVIFDSYQLNVDEATDFQWNVFNYFYLTRKRWQRVLADIAALTIGYCMSQFSKMTSDIKQYYPPCLLLFLNNVFTSIVMIFSAFFFNGATFDLDSRWGVFALFTNAHFTNFLYMSILLSMGTFISFVMVCKIFPDPIVPAIAMTLQPILSTVLFHFAGVQTIPGPYACFGYLLIIPGIITILTGNCLKTRTKEKLQNKEPLIEMKPILSPLRKDLEEVDINFETFRKQY